MPKSLKEIKHFHTGTVLNSSEQDISDDTAAFSLNINPMTEGGILDSIKNDRLVASSDNNIIRALYPISWGATEQYGGTAVYNDTRVIFNDIDLLDDSKSVFDFIFFGSKGRKENLKAKDVRPWVERVEVTSSLNATFTPAAAITSTQETIPYLTNTNTMIGTLVSSGDTTVSGFTDGTATIQIDTNDPSDLADDILVISTPDGKIVQYIIKNSSGTTGTSDGTRIQIFCPTASSHDTDDEIAEEIKTGIEHSNGHGGRVNITRSAGTLTLTYVHTTLDTLLNTGDYITLNTSTFTWASEEVIKIESIDTTNNILNVKRNVFGSPLLAYASTTEYEIYANRLTVDSRQVTTSRFIATLSNWSSYAGNHIGGNGNWIHNSINAAQQESNGLIASSGVDRSVIFSNSDKTITLGRNVTDPNFTEGDTITIYHGADGEDEPNNGKSFKILKLDTSGSTTILTVDTAPTDDTEATDAIYIESNLIKNHTFHHASDEVSPTVEVGSDQDYKVNHWVARNYYHVTGGSAEVTNVYVDASTNTYVARTDSGGYWEDTTADHGADNAASYYPFDTDDAYMTLQSKFNASSVTLSAACAVGENFLNAGDLSRFSVNDIITVDSVDSITNGTFASDASWTKGTGWSIGSGVATATAGTASNINQSAANIASDVIPGVVYKLIYTLTRSAGTIAPYINNNIGTTRSSAGTYTEYIMAGTSTNPIQFVKDSSFAGTVDNVSLTVTEHMKITSMTENKLYVQRGYLNTIETAHANSTAINKCLNPLIKQDVAKERLKAGQSYILTFHAKDLGTSDTSGSVYGGLSVTFNGGYINESGDWIKPELDSNNGYYTNLENIMYEERWINFKTLNKPNGDIAYNIDETLAESGLDTTWRKLELIINTPKNVEFLTDMSIEFASRGEDGTKLGIDLVDLSEYTYILPSSNELVINSVGSIDNSGKKDLVLFDNKDNQLKFIKDFNDENQKLYEVTSDIDKSNFSPDKLNSKDGKASFVSKNRETHIGFGSSSEDSTPQWLGYLNHKLFGVSNNNELYQDEDTVHTYDDSGAVSMSKIALAGEHENLAGVVTSTGSIGDTDTILTITHALHKMVNGNNIVVREYQDIDNSWSGNGIWVVTDASATGSFICKRIVSKDKQPTAIASNNKVSYRPYYYYGIKAGDHHLYRILPDDLYTNVSTLSTTYTAGKVETSLSLPYVPTSITTCYNKDTTNGIGGGRVYILTETGDVNVVNIELAYNKWSKVSTTIVSTIGFIYKSYKWSNDDVLGDINGDTAVYNSLAGESTPTITPSGIPSDIIETKGPNKDFSHSSTNNTDNTLVDFDTRLWVQFRPAGGNNFTSGDRFLFCGLTNSTLTDSNSTIYLGDRTPSTTSLFSKTVTYDRYNFSTSVGFKGGPGLSGLSQDNDDDWGDFPTEDLWKHALYHYWKDDNYSKVRQVAIRNTYTSDYADFTAYGYVREYDQFTAQINFGDNVGWDSIEGNLPAIYVARYGLFAMGDNNCDGLIDGTGLVVPSTTTLPSTINNQEVGLYGYDNEKVCAHAVGLIGGSESPWIRDFGKIDGTNPTESASDDYYLGSAGGAPENMSLEKCLFICSDVHYGDKPFNFDTDYGWTSDTFAAVNWESLGGTSATIITISDTTGLQPGDTVWVEWNGTDGAYTIVKIDSTTQFTIAMVHATLTETATIWPHTIKPFVRSGGTNFTSKGGIKDNHFHWAYNPDNPLDGTIFNSKAGGHFSKTWWTPPSSNGLITNSVQWQQPGMLHRVERLNYRAGYMIRPFDLDDNTFEDLIVGAGTYIDAPVRPESIYHVESSSKTHDNIGGNANNQFASKIFITSPVKDTGDKVNKSKMFICDPTFEYPDILHQIEKESSQLPGFTSNTWNSSFSGNDWKSYAPLIYGKIDAYVTASATTTNSHRNAANCPLITIDPGADVIDNNSLLGASSVWRDANRFAGQMITIVDAVTGIMQTRYIISSNTEGTSAGHDLYVAVHYPFGHAPAANDYFYIWSHKYACTSPIRLFKEKTLSEDFNLDGSEIVAYKADPIISAPIYATTDSIGGIDGNTSLITVDTSAIHNLSTNDVIEIKNTTNYNDYGPHSVTVTSPKQFTISGTFSDVASESSGTWELVEPNYSDSSIANPVEFDMSNALVKSSFGGLDMRKSRTLVTTDDDAQGSAVAAEIAIHSAAHFLNTGDTITFNGNTAAHDGTYEVIDKTTDDFDVTNASTANDTTDAQPITINQWENLVMSTSGGAFIGEIRAGLNAWDTGESTGNIIRKDNSSAIDANKYLEAGEAALTINSPSVGNETNDYFLKSTRYDYKVSLIYDGYQEGLLSNTMWSFEDASTGGSKTRAKLNIKISLKTFSKRLTTVCLYRRDNTESFFRLVKEIPTSSGWVNSDDKYSHNIEDFGKTGASYESRTGLSEVLPSIRLKYGISTEIDGYLFAGDCSHENIENASNQIFRSKPGMYSIFNFANDFIQLKSKPTALVNFAGRLYAFDKTNIYRINQQSLAIEDVYEGVGCLSKDSLIVTEYGLFFADKNGAYMHDGSHPKKISSTIEAGGDSSETWGGTDNINNVSWKTVAGTSLSDIPYVTFDASISSVLFFVNFNSYDSTTANNKSIYYCWSYNLTKQRWDLWELAENVSLGIPFTGDKGGVYIPINNAIYEYKGGTTKRDYSWLSKKLTMEEDSVVKVYNKIKINGLTSDLNLSGDNKESSDRLLIKTSTGDMSTSDATYSESDTQNSQYKLSGTNKKGRWLQFKLEDMTSPIESVGIIYRRKSTK